MRRATRDVTLTLARMATRRPSEGAAVEAGTHDRHVLPHRPSDHVARMIDVAIPRTVEGQMPHLGYRQTPEHRAAISAALMGKARTPLSSEHRAKIGLAGIGRRLSPEHREKIRAANLGKPMSAEHRARLIALNTGSIHSAEHRARTSAALQGHVVTRETRVKISAAKKGRPFSPEHRAKISAAGRGNRNVLDASVKGECVYCLGPATGHDHVIPRGRPGWDDPDNLVVACLSCNSAKRDRTPEEWFADASAD